jgi:molybdate transport system substrate-binding protein
MVSGLLSDPDLEVIGMLPPELQMITVYSGAVTANAKEPDAAWALIRFLATSEAAAVYKARLGL